MAPSSIAEYAGGGAGSEGRYLTKVATAIAVRTSVRSTHYHPPDGYLAHLKDQVSVPHTTHTLTHTATLCNAHSRKHIHTCVYTFAYAAVFLNTRPS